MGTPLWSWSSVGLSQETALPALSVFWVKDPAVREKACWGFRAISAHGRGRAVGLGRNRLMAMTVTPESAAVQARHLALLDRRSWRRPGRVGSNLEVELSGHVLAHHPSLTPGGEGVLHPHQGCALLSHPQPMMVKSTEESGYVNTGLRLGQAEHPCEGHMARAQHE